MIADSCFAVKNPVSNFLAELKNVTFLVIKIMRGDFPFFQCGLFIINKDYGRHGIVYINCPIDWVQLWRHLSFSDQSLTCWCRFVYRKPLLMCLFVVVSADECFLLRLFPLIFGAFEILHYQYQSFWRFCFPFCFRVSKFSSSISSRM